MKKSVFQFLPLIFLVGCGIFKTITVDQLQMGMTKADVNNIFGPPEKRLVGSLTEHGYQEILAYRIGSNDIYALEFMDDRLVRYEFLREDVVYVPPPPMRPVYPIHQMPVEQPPAAKPSPPPPAKPSPLPSSRPVRLERETSRTEAPGRRPGSGKTVQRRSGESATQVAPETNRQGRGSVDPGQSNVNNRSSENTY